MCSAQLRSQQLASSILWLLLFYKYFVNMIYAENHMPTLLRIYIVTIPFTTAPTAKKIYDACPTCSSTSSFPSSLFLINNTCTARCLIPSLWHFPLVCFPISRFSLSTCKSIKANACEMIFVTYIYHSIQSTPPITKPTAERVMLSLNKLSYGSTFTPNS